MVFLFSFLLSEQRKAARVSCEHCRERGISRESTRAAVGYNGRAAASVWSTFGERGKKKIANDKEEKGGKRREREREREVEKRREKEIALCP